MFQLTDIQACEPEALLAATVATPITVTVTTEHDDTSAGCARVTITAPTREQIIAFVAEHWGADDTDWFFDYIERRIEEVTIPAPGHRVAEIEEARALFGPGIYAVTETPDDPSLNPCWVGRADNPVDALDRYARSQGFAGYTDTEMESEVGIFAHPMPGFPGVAGEDGGAFAVFTNTTIYALPVDEDEELAFVPEVSDEEVKHIAEDAMQAAFALINTRLSLATGKHVWGDMDPLETLRTEDMFRGFVRTMLPNIDFDKDAEQQAKMVAVFDVTGLSEEERGRLAMEVAVQAEASDDKPSVPDPEISFVGVEEEVPADRTILVHLNLTVSSGADPWPVEDIVSAVEGALQVGLEGAPIPNVDAILNIDASGEEI